MNAKKSLWFLTTFFFLTSLVLAQRPNQRPMMDRQKMRENINRLRLLRMTEALELTDQQTAKIYPRYYQVEKEKMEIIKAVNSEIRDLRSLLTGGNAKPEEIAARVKAVKELRRNLVQKEQDFEDFLEQNLSEVQKAKYVVFSIDFYRNLGEKLNRARLMPREKREY